MTIKKAVKEIFGKKKLTTEIDEHEEGISEEVQLAVAALLLEMAGRDDDYAPEEVTTIFHILMEEFELEEEECRSFLKKADASRENLGGFINSLLDLNDVQRTRILAMCWKVILSDLTVDTMEERFIEQLRNRLRLSPEQVQEAKEFAENNQI